ncbi:VRR-NUC domain-containing protein, partial [Flavobacteriaceae bacterium]|nr:VRR-NUC domain-containing protein [Flavobacteriaceae bacterium]
MKKSWLKVQKYKPSYKLETYEQQDFVKYARSVLRALNLPEELLFSIPNEGIRNIKNASRMKAEGMTKGILDLMLAIPRNGYHGLFIEMKRVKGSNVSEEQKFIIKIFK